MSEVLAREVFRRAAASIEVLAPPYQEVVELARRQRSRRRRVVAGGTAAALVVVGIATWAATRSSPPPEPGPLHVVVERNPVSIPWYADGRLHLRSVAVDLPGVTDAAAVGGSVVYLDEDGDVGIVDPRGVRSVVGSAGAGSTVVGSGVDNWAAWVHGDESGTRLVVWSVATDEVLATTEVEAGTRLVAIDQDRVYFRDDTGSYAWQAAVPGMAPERVAAGDLADVASATRVYQRGRRIDMVQPLFSVSFLRPGEGAGVSPGGSYVTTRAPGPWEPGSPYVPLLYDTRSGDRMPSGVAPDERVVDSAFGVSGELLYLVANLADLQGATLDGDVGTLLVLRRCDLESGRCSDVAPVRTQGSNALLAD